MPEVVHPVDTQMQYAIIPVIIAIVLLFVSEYLGLWNKFWEVTVAWFPFWHWGA